MWKIILQHAKLSHNLLMCSLTHDLAEGDITKQFSRVNQIQWTKYKIPKLILTKVYCICV
ncbi:hypothetical protein JHK85_055677 [Glycine max]|uniref:Uncharacterized protein n=2 Tax=Glycine subgen. Soja TaxID=1462606 RepID=K7N0P0_SOYBN|nr:hypothetical protein JHK85_055677 [Glycine max]KAH1033994.1 hypothetical protein GYH30_054415 [Glycine max]RZB41898.1 hypothetical protein D0Y65_052764 [Glycine soja]